MNALTGRALGHLPSTSRLGSHYPDPKAEAYSFFLDASTNQILKNLPGEQVFHKEQSTRHVPNPDRAGGDPASSNTVSSDDRNDEPQHGPFGIRPEEESGPAERGERLKSLEDLFRSLRWLCEHLPRLRCRFFHAAPSFPIANVLGPRHSWLRMKKGQRRQALLAELQVGQRFIYVLDVDKGRESLPLLVFRSPDSWQLNDAQLFHVLQRAVELRCRWMSARAKEKLSEYEIKPVTHRYTEEQKYAYALLRAGGLTLEEILELRQEEEETSDEEKM
ncbi:hypothetical protein [Deinococcus wulumuqiensis]|nr:hypothetical protein [Deinococcus wulumuqiensis]